MKKKEKCVCCRWHGLFKFILSIDVQSIQKTLLSVTQNSSMIQYKKWCVIRIILHIFIGWRWPFATRRRSHSNVRHLVEMWAIEIEAVRFCSTQLEERENKEHEPRKSTRAAQNRCRCFLSDTFNFFVQVFDQFGVLYTCGAFSKWNFNLFFFRYHLCLNTITH